MATDVLCAILLLVGFAGVCLGYAVAAAIFCSTKPHTTQVELFGGPYDGVMLTVPASHRACLAIEIGGERYCWIADCYHWVQSTTERV